MNREIKFRAWDKKNKAMRDIWSITWDFTPVTPKMILACNPVINTQYALDEGEFEIMQFTGLKDKNGNEIYEGDIVRMFTHFNHLVDFNEGAFGYWYNSVVEYFISFQSNKNFEWKNNQSDELEIIGNIYQHPELLK